MILHAQLLKTDKHPPGIMRILMLTMEEVSGDLPVTMFIKQTGEEAQPRQPPGPTVMPELLLGTITRHL